MKQPHTAESTTSEELDQRGDELAREGTRRWMKRAADTMRELANDPARLAEIERRGF